MDRVERMMSVDLYEDAARTAYMACFHLAQAYIFERTLKVSKTHKGVQTEFCRLTHDDPRADYATGDAAVIPADEAEAAIATARRFLDHFEPLVDAAASN